MKTGHSISVADGSLELEVCKVISSSSAWSM